MKIASHRDLKVWQRAVELVDCVYSMTKRFPRVEMFGLASQLRRAAVSIPANIAEGNARVTSRDYAHFLTMALGSARELDTLLFISNQQGYVRELELQHCFALLDETCRMLYSVRSGVQGR